VKAIRTEVEVAASPERVWAILSDFPAFPYWSPFVSKVDGRPSAGERLTVRLTPPGGRAMTFKPKILKAEANRELRRLGRLAIPGLFSGEHSFTIEPPGPDRVRVVQAEDFRGLLVPLLSNSLDRDAKAGFAAMNEALKGRAEGKN